MWLTSTNLVNHHGGTEMGNDQQNEGKLQQARGTVKEGIGSATGNEKMEHEGQWDKAKGEIREDIGKVREDVDRAADDWKRDH